MSHGVAKQTVACGSERLQVKWARKEDVGEIKRWSKTGAASPKLAGSFNRCWPQTIGPLKVTTVVAVEVTL